MLVNGETIQAVFWTLKTSFNNAFDAAPSTWEKIGMKIPSSSRENIYAWLERFPRMRRWVGEKDVQSMIARGYTVVNDDFEATVEVDRNDIEDDNLGIYAPQAQSAGYSAKQLPDEIIYELVNDAFEKPCYDGQSFFSNAHVVRGAAISNLSHLPLTIAGQAAAIKTYGAVRTSMRKITDEEGRPLGITPNVLLVPPALEDVANALQTNDR
ncbi:Mu-like prophage major head subunit gpT family protein, partial [Paraburkholderia sp. BR14261]